MNIYGHHLPHTKKRFLRVEDIYYLYLFYGCNYELFTTEILVSSEGAWSPNQIAYGIGFIQE